MKRYASWLIPVVLLLTVSVLTAAKENALAKYKVVEVKHLTTAAGVDAPAEYLNDSYDSLREELAKQGVFGSVVEDGGTISDPDAANARVLECKITEYKASHWAQPYIIVEVTLSSRGDHKVIQQFTTSKIPVNNGAIKVKARYTGHFLAEEIKRNLK
jgi:hypothetical protein